MKKVLLLTLVICMLVSSVAFAAPSIGHIFSLTENGQVYYYMFGSVDKTATDVGLTINGKDYNLDENALAKSQSSGKFGIGIADPNDILGDDFKATPYEVVGEVRSEGTEANIVKAEVADNDVIALNSLTVNGKAVAGFYTGTTETDFYYGLDEITGVEDIPAVSYALSMGNATTSLTEETGGYVYTISASQTGRDGSDKNAEFKVHFREFAEKTVSVRPNIIYRQHYSYMDTMSAFEGLDTYTGDGLTIATNTVEDETSNNNTYLYFAYEVEPISGYAPVSFDLVGLRARYNPLDIYVYDGDLSDVNLPKTVAETEANSELFAGNKGLNDSDSFHLVKFQVPAGEILLNQGIVASSTAVTDGNNILILKSDYPQTGNYPAYILYGDWAKCFMTMNVKYVEKNPKDETDIDTTLSELTINGKDADAVKDNTYYVAVTDLATNDGITAEDIIATPTTEGATYEVSEIVNNQATVTVTSKDGETTKEYIVKFKEMVKEKLAWQYIEQYGAQKCEFLSYKGNAYSSGLTYANLGFYATYNDEERRAMYIDYSTAALPENSKIVGTANISAIAVYHSTYEFYNSWYETITDSCTFDELNPANLLGSHKYANGGSSTISIDFDSSLLNVKTGKFIKVALVDGSKDSHSKINEIPTLTVNYITLD